MPENMPEITDSDAPSAADLVAYEALLPLIDTQVADMHSGLFGNLDRMRTSYLGGVPRVFALIDTGTGLFRVPVTQVEPVCACDARTACAGRHTDRNIERLFGCALCGDEVTDSILDARQHACCACGYRDRAADNTAWTCPNCG